MVSCLCKFWEIGRPLCASSSTAGYKNVVFERKASYYNSGKVLWSIKYKSFCNSLALLKWRLRGLWMFISKSSQVLHKPCIERDMHSISFLQFRTKVASFISCQTHSSCESVDVLRFFLFETLRLQILGWFSYIQKFFTSKIIFNL